MYSNPTHLILPLSQGGQTFQALPKEYVNGLFVAGPPEDRYPTTRKAESEAPGNCGRPDELPSIPVVLNNEAGDCTCADVRVRLKLVLSTLSSSMQSLVLFSMLMAEYFDGEYVA
jgi:hypothetical protein